MVNALCHRLSSSWPSSFPFLTLIVVPGPALEYQVREGTSSKGYSSVTLNVTALAERTSFKDKQFLRFFNLAVRTSVNATSTTRGIAKWSSSLTADPCVSAFRGVSCTLDWTGKSYRVTM